MRRSIVAAVLAGVLLAGWAMPSAAQQNGVIIQNNGVDSADSAAGADNVRVSNNPGNGQSLSGGDKTNEFAPVEKEGTRRDGGPRVKRKPARAERTGGRPGGKARPPMGTVPPAGVYQAYPA